MYRYDVIIIGSGPAGIESAINLKIRNKSFLLFGRDNLSAKIERAPKIDNYLGLPGIGGKELADKFRTHMDYMNIALQPEQVSSVYPMKDYFAVATNKNTYEATAIIAAGGVVTSKPFPGEERLLGRGVGYCATCDAPLYKGKTVAVVGYGDEAVHEANFTAELAAKLFYIPAAKHGATLSAQIETVEGKVLEIAGESKVESLVLQDRTLKVDGVFVLRDTIAPEALIPGIETRGGFIAVDSEMRTNLPGCFAAGDCTGKPHQYMRAAGQGQTAALNAAAYIDTLQNR